MAVALANKTARIAWAVMHRHEKWCVSGRKRQFSGAQVTPQVTRNRPEMTPRCGVDARRIGQHAIQVEDRRVEVAPIDDDCRFAGHDVFLWACKPWLW